MLRFIGLAIAAFGLSPGVFAGGVRIVDATGTRNFPDIQSAIDAAGEGDVLLVGAGTYPGFTLNGKSLSIFAVPAGTQAVSVGNVSVLNVLDKTAVLCGLSAGMLTVDNCSGYIAFQDCSFAGAGWPSNGRAASISGSVEVIFSGCVFVGHDAPACVGGCSGAGAGGLGIQVGASTLAAYGCTFRGGRGADCCTDTGAGGDGGWVLSQSWLFAAACGFIGGDSGNGNPPCNGGLGTWCGPGGDGLEVYGELHALSNNYSGGSEGGNCCPWLGPGYGCVCTWTGGLCDFLPGQARSFHLPWLSVDRAPWSLTVSGVTGDAVFLNRSLAPVFQYEPTLSGVCTAKLPPYPAVAPLGTVPSSGSLVVGVPQRLLPDNVVAQVHYLQGYIRDPSGTPVLGSPTHVLSLNWNSLPDCNGNGINDYAEVIAGVTPDLDHDLKPDGCP